MQMFVCLSNEKLSRALNLHVSGFMSLSGCSKGSLRVLGSQVSLSYAFLGFVGKIEPEKLCLVFWDHHMSELPPVVPESNSRLCGWGSSWWGK